MSDSLLKGIATGALVGLTINVGVNGSRIAQQAERQSSLYLCVEAAKLHIKNPSCDTLMRAKP